MSLARGGGLGSRTGMGQGPVGREPENQRTRERERYAKRFCVDLN
jgi:hypothetical protein